MGLVQHLMIAQVIIHAASNSTLSMLENFVLPPIQSIHPPIQNIQTMHQHFVIPHHITNDHLLKPYCTSAVGIRFVMMREWELSSTS